jgi:hypothetical protein
MQASKFVRNDSQDNLAIIYYIINNVLIQMGRDSLCSINLAKCRGAKTFAPVQIPHSQNKKNTQAQMDSGIFHDSR